MKERGGDIRAQVIPNAQKATLRGVVNENVARGTVVSTDEFVAHSLLGPDGFEHGAVKHGGKEWANYEEDRGITFCTNGVESFWKLFKDSVDSTHIHISQKHMNTYLGEFTFRSNHR
jgi:transposase-like protein